MSVGVLGQSRGWFVVVKRVLDLIFLKDDQGIEIKVSDRERK